MTYTLGINVKYQYISIVFYIFLQTFHGLIYANKNTADGISEVLKVLQKYVPFAGDENERIYTEQGIVVDQLSVESAVYCVLQMSNGYTPEEGLSGMHFEAGDFQAGIKFKQVMFCLGNHRTNE